MNNEPRAQSTRFQESVTLERKSSVTRARLMDAAINVIAKKGVAQSSIVEITRFAGMANGTFYLYFKNKKELLDQVGFAISAAVVKSVHDPALEGDDAAHVVARHLLCFLRIAGSEPTWITLIIDSLDSTDRPRDQIEHGIRSDINGGRESGRFDVPECEEVVSIIVALCRTGLKRVRDGAELSTVQLRIMEAGLRVLGISPNEARNIAVETLDLHIWESFAFPNVNFTPSDRD